MGLKVPQDIALVSLERRKKESDWTGMDQHNELVGEAAVKKLSDLLNRNTFEDSENITATLITPQWIDSETC